MLHIAVKLEMSQSLRTETEPLLSGNLQGPNRVFYIPMYFKVTKVECLMTLIIPLNHSHNQKNR